MNLTFQQLHSSLHFHVTTERLPGGHILMTVSTRMHTQVYSAVVTVATNRRNVYAAETLRVKWENLQLLVVLSRLWALSSWTEADAINNMMSCRLFCHESVLSLKTFRMNMLLDLTHSEADCPSKAAPAIMWSFFFSAVVHSDQEENRSLHQLRPEEEIQRCRADWGLRCESSLSLPVQTTSCTSCLHPDVSAVWKV